MRKSGKSQDAGNGKELKYLDELESKTIYIL